jgi:hypothetical protein
MKSKRQEELPKKTLSQPVSVWQMFFQRYGSRILLGLTLVVLAVLVIRYRTETARQREATAKASVVRARQDLQQLRQDMTLSSASPELLAARRDQLTAQIMAELSEALADSSDSDATLKADAYTIRGDLYWALANSPVFPQAATRPSLATKESPDILLGEAEADYRHVIEQYPNEILDWSTAEMGLAAIAEDRGKWDDARTHYDEIVKRSDLPEMVKSTAELRLALLTRISQPVLVGPYPATAASASAATMPGEMPGAIPMASMPILSSSQPAAPTSQPSAAASEPAAASTQPVR